MLDTKVDLTNSLQGRTVFLTGGLGGIGRASVDAFLAHGARVAFTFAAGVERVEDAERLVALAPTRLSAHPLDLRSAAVIRDSLHGAHARWGRLDILVNNAAVGSATVQTYATEEGAQDSSLLQINADGALKVCQAFLELTSQATSSDPFKIINMSSVGGGIQVFPGFRLADGMSKAAVAFMTRQLAAEQVHGKVDVFALCPGATATPMFFASTLAAMEEQERCRYIASLPKGRLIEPSEIAHLILFLASSYSRPLHGAVIDASMGLGVRPGLQDT
ncbi:SDR family NAD(P)-dependent oxidoreductase [Pseudomonas aeruginosa]